MGYNHFISLIAVEKQIFPKAKERINKATRDNKSAKFCSRLRAIKSKITAGIIIAIKNTGTKIFALLYPVLKQFFNEFFIVSLFDSANEM